MKERVEFVCVTLVIILARVDSVSALVQDGDYL